MKKSYFNNPHLLPLLVLFFLASNSLANNVTYNIPHCKTYSDWGDRCTFCENGWGVNDDGECSECESPCKLCGEDMHKCTGCKDGYFVKNDECKKCGKACKTCSSASSCTVCKDKNCLKCSTTACTACGSGYFVDGNGECSACNKHCSKCSDSTTCEVCDTGYFHLVDSPKCEQCDERCSKCGKNGCEKCLGGYFPNKATGFCESCGYACLECDSKLKCNVCEDGYFQNRTGECQKRDVNCLKANKTGCEECYPGYFVSEISGLCDACMSGCSKCSSTTDCLECFSFMKEPDDDGECQLRIVIIAGLIGLAIGVALIFLKCYYSSKMKERMTRRLLRSAPDPLSLND